MCEKLPTYWRKLLVRILNKNSEQAPSERRTAYLSGRGQGPIRRTAASCSRRFSISSSFADMSVLGVR
jgi:hypothetical protein